MMQTVWMVEAGCKNDEEKGKREVNIQRRTRCLYSQQILAVVLVAEDQHDEFTPCQAQHVYGLGRKSEWSLPRSYISHDLRARYEHQTPRLCFLACIVSSKAFHLTPNGC